MPGSILRKLFWWTGRSENALAELRSRLQRFRHLLAMNNRVLELIGDVEAKLSGEFLFDSHYLDSVETELSGALTAVVDDLAGVSGRRWPELNAALDRVLASLKASCDPERAILQAPLTLPLDDVGTEDAAVVGEKMARLGEIRNRLCLPVPDGFVITLRASRLLLATEPIAARLRRLDSEGAAASDSDVESLVAAAPVPVEVAHAIRKALQAFDRSQKFAVRSSAAGEDGRASFAGQYRTELNVPFGDVLNAWRRVVASLFTSHALDYRRRAGLPLNEAAMAVGCLAMIPAQASGVGYSVDPLDPDSEAMVITAARGLGSIIVEGRGAADRFCIGRIPPHQVSSRVIASKSEVLVTKPEGGVQIEPIPEDERRLPAISDERLARLAESICRIERHMRCPQDVEWALAPNQDVTILQARPLAVAAAGHSRAQLLAQARVQHRVLLAETGELACRGVAAGKVFVVDAEGNTNGFAAGNILVTRFATPSLSSVVASAAGLVAEVGAVTGHLATVAREYRVPSIVNAQNATRRLTPGTIVTLDADEGIVYDGAVEGLLRYELLSGQAYQETREFRLLRGMLKHIAPLHLKDPSASDFSAVNCLTCHDIIRFAHEQAIAEISRPEGITLTAGQKGCTQLELAVPLDLSLVDLGGGLAMEAPSASPVTRDQITCRPLCALLDGLLTPGAWSTTPTDMDLAGLMASATRAGPLTVPGSTAVQRNLAIISDDYLNLSLRVGYHFNVVECLVGQEPEAGYILFRFVGGVTDTARRARRARLLTGILRHYGFQVEQKADLVVGWLKGAPWEILEDQLRMVGRLIGFSRQLDVLLRDEEIVDRLTDHFRSGCYDVSLALTERKDCTMADTVEVMVLDDETTVVERLKEFLEDKGMSVETFTDSSQAVARLADKQFDVVVTDLKMKGPTGLDVLVTVKQQELPTEVIIITGYRTIEATRGAEVVGAYGFIDKPFQMEEVYRLVRKAARRAQKQKRHQPG